MISLPERKADKHTTNNNNNSFLELIMLRKVGFMNKVILMGRLTRDAEMRHGTGENATLVARYTLAVDRRFKKDGSDQQADFISCVAFGKTAEFIEKYVHKGTKIVVTGRLQTGSYTNKDGQKVYTTDVVAEDVEFAESKRADSSSATAASSGSDAPDDGFMNIPDGIDEELPFA